MTLHDPSAPAMFASQTPAASRREMLRQAACGFGGLAFAGLAAQSAQAEALSQAKRDAASILPPQGRDNPAAARLAHLPARAKRVIFIFMQGGPSQVDSFDPKPLLDRDHDKKINFRNARRRAVRPERVMKALWKFKQYGESGQPVSELFPHIAQHVDDLCFIHSMHTEGVAHGPSTLFLHTGATNQIRPSMGAWIGYGLGSENRNLPGFVTINPPMSKGGPRNWSNAFLPAVYQGTPIGRAGAPASQARINHIRNSQLSPDEQRRHFEFLQRLNREQVNYAQALAGSAGRDRLEATIESYELAYRMQMHAPQALDLAGESKATQDLYGIGEKPTDDFGRQCLIARRLAERDVRYIQINYSDNSATPRWDQHGNMPQHMTHAKATDKPVAGLLADLKSRGMLEDTLVWWGGEFGRTPFAQGKNGRDHNPDGFTIFLAGGGVKAGYRHGATDDYGHMAMQDKVHMHDLHATVLHLLGLNHERLTYRHAGRDFRLTDVFGRVVDEVIA